jgi:hypothetical protein
MAGHWNSEGGQWKWVAAHWEQSPSPSAVWVSGHWAPQSGSWVWVNGAWNVTDADQARSAPPQPPSQPAGQALPASSATLASGQMPSTPAPSPYVDGEDGPGGVPRAVDEGAVVTDYGPSYASYPAYGWAGYPWYWDGAFVGAIGFGTGFYGGYGHYGYGHYGYGRAGYGRGGYAHGGSYGGSHGYAGHSGGGHGH